jgi:predicted DNA-binding transcriptional regulator AlpA
VTRTVTAVPDSTSSTPPITTTPDPYLVTEEVAALFRTSPSTVRYWRHLGKGPRSIKVGRRVLYRQSDVQAWADAHPSGVTP